MAFNPEKLSNKANALLKILPTPCAIRDFHSFGPFIRDSFCIDEIHALRENLQTSLSIFARSDQANAAAGQKARLRLYSAFEDAFSAVSNIYLFILLIFYLFIYFTKRNTNLYCLLILFDCFYAADLRPLYYPSYPGVEERIQGGCCL